MIMISLNLKGSHKASHKLLAILVWGSMHGLSQRGIVLSFDCRGCVLGKFA